MKVKDLIAKLRKHPGDTPVIYLLRGPSGHMEGFELAEYEVDANEGLFWALHPKTGDRSLKDQFVFVIIPTGRDTPSN